MFQDIARLLKRKSIGLVISDGKIIAVNEEKGAYFQEKLPDSIEEPYWEHVKNKYLAKLLKKAVLQAGQGLCRPNIAFVVSSDRTEPGKRAVLKMLMDATNAKTTYLLENFLITALGHEIINDGSDLTKKLYLFPQKKVSFIGLIFTAAIQGLITIPKGYGELTAEDIRLGLDEVLKGLPNELPSVFY